MYHSSVRASRVASEISRRLLPLLPRSRVVIATLALALLPGVAYADEPSAADIASARKIGFEGIKLADKGDCAAAIDKLARAEKLFHAPTTLGRLGECQVQVGKVVEGTENLGRVAREDLPSNAPAAFVTARARARKQLAAATPMLAHAKIVVKAPPDATVSVAIDGVPVNAANVGEERVLDPGPHLVEATAPGYVKASSAINLPEGGTEQVTLKMIVDPEAARALRAAAANAGSQPSSAGSPSSSPPGAADTTRPPPGAETPAPNRTLSYVVLGVGVVGVGLGTVFGLSTLSKRNDLADACPNKTCRSTEQSNLDSAKTSGTISTIAFAAGGAALIAGGILFFTASGSGSSSSSGSGSGSSSASSIGREGAKPTAAALSARPYFDGTAAGVTGSF